MLSNNKIMKLLITRDSKIKITKNSKTLNEIVSNKKAFADFPLLISLE